MISPNIYIGLSCCVIPVTTMIIGVIQVAKSWGTDADVTRNGIILIFGSITTAILLIWLSLYAIPEATVSAVNGLITES